MSVFVVYNWFDIHTIQIGIVDKISLNSKHVQYVCVCVLPHHLTIRLSYTRWTVYGMTLHIVLIKSWLLHISNYEFHTHEGIGLWSIFTCIFYAMNVNTMRSYGIVRHSRNRLYKFIGGECKSRHFIVQHINISNVPFHCGMLWDGFLRKVLMMNILRCCSATLYVTIF